ncbi:YaaC family protein [Streptomyces bluensis]|uniref:YaaC family protein n=1 Tax=Streptomyces bluensis TaxID=33897 RepID=UPI0036B9E13E
MRGDRCWTGGPASHRRTRRSRPTPLMSWWLLLYSFSMLSRYQPRTWSEALDADKSSSAAALEYALDIALEVVPHPRHVPGGPYSRSRWAQPRENHLGLMWRTGT